MITKYRTLAPTHSPFNDLMTGMLGRDIGHFLGNDDVASTTPRVNITETPEAYLLSFLVPGFGKEELKIEAEKDTLTVSGERTESSLKEEERYTRREFKFGTFSRSFKLPTLVDLDAVTAEHVNGVLNVRIPRTQPVKPETRKITIG